MGTETVPSDRVARSEGTVSVPIDDVIGRQAHNGSVEEITLVHIREVDFGGTLGFSERLRGGRGGGSLSMGSGGRLAATSARSTRRMGGGVHVPAEIRVPVVSVGRTGDVFSGDTYHLVLRLQHVRIVPGGVLPALEHIRSRLIARRYILAHPGIIRVANGFHPVPGRGPFREVVRMEAGVVKESVMAHIQVVLPGRVLNGV